MINVLRQNDWLWYLEHLVDGEVYEEREGEAKAVKMYSERLKSDNP